MNKLTTVRVLFVCLGNICRSPTAHAVFAALCEQRGYDRRIEVDSCGTGDWHIGHPPDKRATDTASKRGYDLSPLRARLVTADDFEHFDYILAMDNSNLRDLHALRPPQSKARLSLFLDFAEGTGVTEVPDPYHGDSDSFFEVLDLVERASEGLLQVIEIEHLNT